jgi:hypothetical protein
MIAKLLPAVALLALLAVTAPAQASTVATQEPAVGSCGPNSHYVHPYCRKNGTCVRGHCAGNSHSGNHWHLNKDGSDTVAHANGSHQTVPNVAPPK